METPVTPPPEPAPLDLDTLPAVDPRPAGGQPGDARRVTVGIADTEESDAAIRWGADHARLTGSTLHLVHAFVWPLMNVDVDPVPGIAGSGLRAAADHLVAHATEVAQEVAPEVAVTSEIVEGRAAAVLLAASAQTDVLAVGSRGLGRVLAMVMGSTSLALARHAACPVMVVRGEPLTEGPIGVAYEGSELGAQAMIRAGQLAAEHGTEVHVVIGIATPAAEHARILRAARERIHASVPEVTVELGATATARDARSLIAASEDVRTLVVAARGEGAVSAASQIGAVVQFAHTPIWIERPLRQD